jgi:FkbM family methyltransferase
MPRIILDIGANDGNSCITLCYDPENIVFAFEPDPRQMPRLRELESSFPNYHVIQAAVSNITGFCDFNIITGDAWHNPETGERGGGGLCSLNTMKEHEKWKNSHKIQVPVIRLEDFIEKNNITEIEYLHCDVQGKDLEVLMGLGKHISRVKRGCIEMPHCLRKKYYVEQVYDSGDAVRFLHENDFLVDSIKSNDEFVNEVNINYHRITDSDRVPVEFEPLRI